MINVPNGWATTNFGSLLTQILGGGTPSKSVSTYFEGSVPFMTVKDMTERFPIDTVDHISEEAIQNSPTTIVPADTLIVATRMSLGKIVRPKFQTAINQDLKAIFLTDGIDKTFIEHWWRYRSSFIQALGTGTTVKGIRLEDIRTLSINLAPLNEQKRIADKLDALLSRVDACRERLDHVPQILKRFRQAVLSAATSGVLTEEWREKKDRQFDWKTYSGAQVFPFITSGSRGWAAYYADSGSKFLRVGNLDHDTIKLDLSQIQHVSPPLGAEGVRTRVKVGDILISITADVGMIGFISKDIGEAYINQHLCLARQNGSYVGAYLAYYLASPTGGLQQLTAAQRGVTKAGLTLGDIRNLMINIPEEDEQTEIVRSVEQLFSFVDQIEQRVNGAQSRVSHITQSILAKAFRGELTAEWREQNPDLISGENSAEALIVRIKAEKVEAVRVKKTNRKSVNTKAGKNMKPKMIIPVAVALKAAGTPLAAQALLTQSGYSSDATTEDLERFFLDIREQLKLGSILRERSGDEDIFALNK